MSAPMVRAILDGTKTQTRRVVKSQPEDVTGATWLFRDGLHHPCEDLLCRGMLDPIGPGILCPYGVPGDRLWVRETWGLHLYGDYTCWCRDSIKGRTEDDLRLAHDVAYAADAMSVYDFWRPSIHMPRWASRITIEVTSVRVERLQDISEEDARAEGLDGTSEHNLRGQWRRLWTSINGAESWAANPWVWVVGFKRVGVDHG